LFSQFYTVIEEHEEQIKKLKEYADYESLMKEDENISRHLDKVVGNWRLQSMIGTWKCLYYMIWHLLVSYFKTGQYNDDLFNRMYCDLESFFYNGYIPTTIVAPLDNFRCNANVIDLTGVSIRKIHNDELNDFLKTIDETGLTSNRVYFFNHVVEYKHKEKKFIGSSTPSPPHRDTSDHIIRLITALRLFKSGAIGFSYIKARDDIKIPIRVGDTLSRGPFNSFGFEPYTLNSEEITDFTKYWQKFRGVDFSKNLALSLAIRRFNAAYHDALIEDRIIDYSIKYGGLFSKEGEVTDSTTQKKFPKMKTEVLIHFAPFLMQISRTLSQGCPRSFA
jgi:hypothetical protein